MANTPVTLPTELWIRVLENNMSNEALPEMWNAVRHVSTTFKQAVEAIFRENILPQVWITYDLGMYALRV